MSRRHLAGLVTAATLLGAFLPAAQAQDYPSHPVKIIVPFGAGGPADVYARVLAQYLGETLKQPFVIENRPGAGSIIGTDAVAKSDPDGYTLLLMSNTHTVNETLTPNKPFKLMTDFVAVAPINYSDLMMVVHPSVPANNREGIRRAREIETGRLELCLLRSRHAVSHGRRIVQSHERHRYQHIPHKASGEARNAVLGGHVQMMFDAVTTMSNAAKAGQVKALATTGAKRSELSPDVPTVSESGVPGYEATIWLGTDGAGQDAEADHRQAQRRDRQGDQPARREGSLGEAGRRADGDVAAGIRRLSAQGYRQMGGCGEKDRRVSELIAAARTRRDLLERRAGFHAVLQVQ